MRKKYLTSLDLNDADYAEYYKKFTEICGFLDYSKADTTEEVTIYNREGWEIRITTGEMGNKYYHAHKDGRDQYASNNVSNVIEYMIMQNYRGLDTYKNFN